MTYRERRERRAERLRGWAEKREARSRAAFGAARRLADAIPFGQPILVGHHSEKHARRDQERIHNNMGKGIEHEEKARGMNSKAAEIDRQADHAIYSDDRDAVERLRERIAGLEAERERAKLVNKAVRKHGLEALYKPAPPFDLTVEEKRELLQLCQLCPYHEVEKKGWPSYKLTNLGGNISKQRERLRFLEAAQRVAETLQAEDEP